MKKIYLLILPLILITTSTIPMDDHSKQKSLLWSLDRLLNLPSARYTDPELKLLKDLKEKREKLIKEQEHVNSLTQFFKECDDYINYKPGEIETTEDKTKAFQYLQILINPYGRQVKREQDVQHKIRQQIIEERNDFIKNLEKNIQELSQDIDKHQELKKIKKRVEYTNKIFTFPENLVEKQYQDFFKTAEQAQKALDRFKIKSEEFLKVKSEFKKSEAKYQRGVQLLQQAEHLGDNEEFEIMLQNIGEQHLTPLEQEKEQKEALYLERQAKIHRYEQKAKKLLKEANELHKQLPQLPQHQQNKLLTYPQKTALPAPQGILRQTSSSTQLIQFVAHAQHSPEIPQATSPEEHPGRTENKGLFAANVMAQLQEQYDQLPDEIKNISKESIDLVPDDITPKGTWSKEQLLDVPTNTFEEFSAIRLRDTYVPHNVNNKNDKFIAFVVIHGTFGRGTPAYFDDQNRESQEFRDIKRFAAWYSAANQQQLELTSYLWSGSLWNNRREKAARSLTNYLQLPHYDNADKIVLLSHSHGCNVANQVTHLLNKPVELMIHNACPNRKEPFYQPGNCKQVLYFHSDNDWTTVAGRASMERDVTPLYLTIGTRPSLAFIKLASSYMESKLGINLDILSETLKELLYASTNISSLYNSPIFLQNFKEMSKRTNHLPAQNGKIITGFNVTIDGQQPGHSGVTKVARALPELITFVHRNHFSELTKSGTFDLAVDGEGKKLALDLKVDQSARAQVPLTAAYLSQTLTTKAHKKINKKSGIIKKKPYLLEMIVRKDDCQSQFMSVNLDNSVITNN